MLRDVSWLVSAFLIMTMALAGVCARHVDKRNSKRADKRAEKYHNRPADVPKPVPREYKHPREYIVDDEIKYEYLVD